MRFASKGRDDSRPGTLTACATLLLFAAVPMMGQLAIVTDTVPDAVLGQGYPAVNIATSGAAGPVTWSFVNAPSPPPGFVVGRSVQDNTAGTFCYGASTGGASAPVCTGTVQTFPGIYNFVVRAQDGTSTVQKTFTFTVQNTLRISTLELPDAAVNQTYSAQLLAAGGPGPFAWQLIDGALPPGINLDGNGLLSGSTGSLGASYFFTIRLNDTSSGLFTFRRFVINVLGTFQITTSTLPQTILNQAMTPFTMQAVGGQNLGWSVPNGWTLPAGLNLSSQGLLSGTPTIAGAYRLPLQVNSSTQTEPVARYFNLYVTLGVLGIVEADLPVASVGLPYSVTLTPSGGLPPYNWAFDTNVTQGMQINPSTGTITGTLQSFGSFPLPVAITDATGKRVVKPFTMVVPGPLGISTTTLPNASQGANYSQTLLGTGGQPPYRWTITLGTLPAGLAIDAASGVIQGIATNPGLSEFTVTLTDFALHSSSRQLSITVAPNISISTSSLPDGTTGTPYSQTLAATGAQGTVNWTVFSGTLPAGLGLNAATGEIAGTPTAAGTFNFTIRATDGVSTPSQRALSIGIYAPLSLTTLSLVNASRSVAYSQTLNASGGKAPLTWSVSTGTPPPGLTLDSVSGVLQGVPTTTGVFQFGVTVTDAGLRTSTRQFSITVVQGIVISTSSLPAGTLGVPYSQTLTATGAQGTVTWSVVSGALPAGLALNAATGVISGPPTAPGIANFTIRAADGVSLPNDRALSINIVAALAITTSSLADGITGTAYSQTFIATGAQGTVTWSVLSGTLPAGLTLNAATGVISGPPGAAGTANFTIRAADGVGLPSDRAFSISIFAPLSISTLSLPNGSRTVAYSQSLAASGGKTPYTWSLFTGTLPAGLGLSSAGVVSGTPTALGTSQFQVNVSDSGSQSALATFTITIADSLPPLPAVSFPGLPDSSPAARQPSVSVNLASAYPTALTGTLTLTFASSVGGDDQTVQFSTGSRTLNFSIAAGATQATFASGTVAVLTGTVAGTITITSQFSAGGQNVTPSPAPAKTIAVEQAAPVISTVTLTRSGSTLTVVVTGYATSREMISGTYRFSASSGNTLSQSDIAVPLTSAFTTWFSSVAANATGGNFRLTVPFTIQGDATAVNLTSVTLTNTRGSSPAVGL